MLAELGRGLIEGLLPTRCASCDVLGPEPFCAICSETLVPAAPFSLSGLSSAQSCFEYGGALSIALARFKYDHREDSGRALGLLFAAHAPRSEALIVPVPLSAARLTERGFNQALLLARALDQPIAPRALIRTRDAPPQVGSPRDRRAANVRGAFFTRDPGAIEGRDVLLVDDVITTGATMRAASAALFAAGARSVGALSLARAEWGADLG